MGKMTVMKIIPKSSTQQSHESNKLTSDSDDKLQSESDDKHSSDFDDEEEWGDTTLKAKSPKEKNKDSREGMTCLLI